MRLVFAVLAALCCSTSLPARSMDANALLGSCESFLRAYRPAGEGFQLQGATGPMHECWGFINALQQLSAVVDEGRTTPITGACPPPAASAVQLLRVVVAYLQKH